MKIVFTIGFLIVVFVYITGAIFEWLWQYAEMHMLYGIALMITAMWIRIFQD